jgi:peptidyl-prolyl cis-trans isomerase SurA
MKIKKKILALLFISLYSTAILSLENKIIVKVNNDIISSYELKNKILTTLFLANEGVNQKNINKSKPLVLKNLIELKIKRREISKYKIDISDSEFSENLNKYAKNDLNSFKNEFKTNKIDYEIFKQDFKTELKWRKLIYYLYNKKVEIPESEINSQLKKILSDEEKNVDYRFSELVISFKNESEKNKKIKEMKEQINLIGFDKSIQKFSESLSKNNLGDLGWVNSTSLSSVISKKIVSMKINDISDPIIMGNNILFLKLNNIREVKKEEIDNEELKNRILNSKKNQMFNMFSSSHLSKLKNIATIEYK